MKPENVSKTALLIIVALISIIFLFMIRHFLMAIILAGIFSGLMYPVYLQCLKWFRGKRIFASLATLIVIVFLILIPLSALTGVVTSQAIHIGKNVTPWVQKQINNPGELIELLQKLPFYEDIAVYREPIVQKGGELVAGISKYLLNSLSEATMQTVNVVFMTLIFLYTMFFFLMDGEKVLKRVLFYLPLEDHDERRILEKFTSVARATLKGTLVVGMIQGGLAGLALWVVGFNSAVFWGVIMLVLSVIPGVGTALVWGPAAIFLAFNGNYPAAIGLILFCGLVVGSVDNFLRPFLVGKDTQMHELMILFGTLGGIVMFGVVGIVIGPIIAALFVTVWDIYGIVFQEVLPDVGMFHSNNGQQTKDKN